MNTTLTLALSTLFALVPACSPSGSEQAPPQTPAPSAEAPATTTATTATDGPATAATTTTAPVATAGPVAPAPTAPTKMTDSPGGAAGATCGTRGAAPCATGLYCGYEAGASCGRADAPGKCKAPTAVCTKELRPVCGCDGKTYPNACSAGSASTGIDHPGKC